MLSSAPRERLAASFTESYILLTFAFRDPFRAMAGMKIQNWHKNLFCVILILKHDAGLHRCSRATLSPPCMLYLTGATASSGSAMSSTSTTAVLAHQTSETTSTVADNDDDGDGDVVMTDKPGPHE